MDPRALKARQAPLALQGRRDRKGWRVQPGRRVQRVTPGTLARLVRRGLKD